MVNPFSALSAKIFAGLSLVLLIACGALLLRGNYHEARADNCEIARANDRKAYELAAKQAEAKAIAQKQAVEASYRAKAQEADNDYQIALARAQRASDAYVARMRAEVARGASGRSSAASDRGNPQEPIGPDADAELVAITRDDLSILVENSVRLENAIAWAKTLNVEPIPDPAF